MSYAEPDWPFATLQRLAVLPAQTGQEEKRGKAVGRTRECDRLEVRRQRYPFTANVESFLHLLLHDLDLVLFL
jgi:hypothetical protein